VNTTSPHIIILAGANGAGKSTAAPKVLYDELHITEFVNADVIARGLSGFSPETVALRAGRIMLERLNELAAARASFAFETTLSGRAFAPWLEKLLDAGYSVHVFYVWVSSAELAIARVAERVRKGGHSIPEETIRRRYFASLNNLFELYLPLSLSWQIVDNSSVGELIEVASGVGTDSTNIVDQARWNKINALARR
jgi:predicted ABC-type ATPase